MGTGQKWSDRKSSKCLNKYIWSVRSFERRIFVASITEKIVQQRFVLQILLRMA